MNDKIKIIFIPTLLTLLGITIIYTLLHYLFIKLELVELKKIITNFGIPLTLTGLAVWILLRPKFKMLNLEVKQGSWRDFYSVILWVVLTIPVIIAQEYIITASGELTELNSIDDINTVKQTKFYKVKNYFIDRKAIGIHSSFDTSGKYNEHFNMHIYIALPIFETEADTIKSECSAWLGIEYQERINNRLEASEKEKRYQEFATESQTDFENKDVSKFVYLDRIWNSDEKEGLIEAIKKNTIIKGNQIILVPITESFEARNGNKLLWIFYSSVIGLSLWLLMVLIPKIDETHLRRIKDGKPDKEAREEVKYFVDFLKPKKGYYVTPIIIYLNLAIYVLMIVLGLGFISFNGHELLNWGANYGPLTETGDWWRLLTSIFLHGGLIHFLANMYGLLFIGILLEPLLGKTKFLTIYLLTGILGSMASIWWYEATISVGASGAIFGLYGLFLVILITKKFPVEFRRTFLISTFIFIGYNLLMGLFGGIDNAAHVGGLLSGFVIGLSITHTLKARLKEDEVR